MLRKLGFLLFFAITLAGSSGLRAEENILWSKYVQTNAYTFHPNNQIFAYGHWDMGVILADVLTGEPIDTLINTDEHGGNGIITSMAFNSTGTKLAVAIVDFSTSNGLAKLSIWDMETKEETVIEKVEKYDAMILHIQFTPNDSLLIYDIGFANDSSGVYKLNMADFKKTKLKISRSLYPTTFSISRDSKYIAFHKVTDNYDEIDYSTLYIYDLVNDSISNIICDEFTNALFSPAKDELVVLKWHKTENSPYWSNENLTILDVESKFEISKTINLPLAYNIEGYELSSDGRYIVCSCDELFILSIKDNIVKYKYPNLNAVGKNAQISKNMQYLAISSIMMLNARFENSTVTDNHINQYFNILQDVNYTNIIITKLNQELNINSIKVSDITGNIVSFVNDPILLTNEQITISTDNLADGTYYMNITTNTGVYSHSFIITR